MRTLALISLLLLAGCGSSGGERYFRNPALVEVTLTAKDGASTEDLRALWSDALAGMAADPASLKLLADLIGARVAVTVLPPGEAISTAADAPLTYWLRDETVLVEETEDGVELRRELLLHGESQGMRVQLKGRESQDPLMNFDAWEEPVRLVLEDYLQRTLTEWSGADLQERIEAYRARFRWE